jgi:amylosucrase
VRLKDDMADSVTDAVFDTLWPDVERQLSKLYGADPDFPAWLAALAGRVRNAADARAPDLKDLDADRVANGPWWARPQAIGYSTYVDRFGGDLRGVRERLDYLSDLRVTYLHLLPLLKARAGDSDGGYAIADFRMVDPRFGTNEDFRTLISTAHTAGIRVVIDLVCNHTADDHPWALAARRGEAPYADYYHFIDDPDQVRALEQSLVEVFPDTAPGNFTYVPERESWVWTTFYPFQWDLNYANRDVFFEMTSVLLDLANMGVDGFRLDSAPFLWKEAGASCRNRPEVHAILAAWRAILSIAAPNVALKAEAIERLEDVLPLFGPPGGPPECDLAYNNGVMAGLWASLALGKAEPVIAMLRAGAAKPANGVWINYLRCHDDIIFGALSPYVSQAEQARAARFLAGGPGSFSHGRPFQQFDGVPSVNGTAASLCGFDEAANDDAALARLQLLYGVLYALPGLPVVYMGDEIALLNDKSFERDPARRAEGRWLQRPEMDWIAADQARAGRGSSASLLARFKHLAAIRASAPAFADEGPVEPIAAASPSLLSFVRGRGAERIQIIANVSDQAVRAPLDVAGAQGWRDLLSGAIATGQTAELPPYGLVWAQAS